MSGLSDSAELPVVVAISSWTGLLSQTTGEGEEMELTLNVYSEDPGFTVIAVGGEIDVYTAPKLREKLISLVEAGSYQLIVDMEGVEFLDSTGLGVLVGGLKRVRAHDGWVALVCTQSRMLHIFRITGLNRVFSIYDTAPEATAPRQPRPAPGSQES